MSFGHYFNNKQPDHHIYSFDINHRITSCNESQAVDIGFDSPDEIIGKPLDELFDISAARNIIKNNEEVLIHRKSFQFIETVVFEGIETIYQSTKYPVFDSENHVIGIMGLSTPINQPNELALLSHQQYKCLYYLVLGNSIKLIAECMDVSYKTVEHYLANIRKKLNCKTTIEIIARYKNNVHHRPFF